MKDKGISPNRLAMGSDRPRTADEIAKVLGITRQAVDFVERFAIRKLWRQRVYELQLLKIIGEDE